MISRLRKVIFALPASTGPSITAGISASEKALQKGHWRSPYSKRWTGASARPSVSCFCGALARSASTVRASTMWVGSPPPPEPDEATITTTAIAITARKAAPAENWSARRRRSVAAASPSAATRSARRSSRSFLALISEGPLGHDLLVERGGAQVTDPEGLDAVLRAAAAVALAARVDGADDADLARRDGEDAPVFDPR